jgi:hypothetical protein
VNNIQEASTMRLSPLVFKFLAVFLFTFEGPVMAATQGGLANQRACPNRPLDEIRAQYLPAPVQPGEAMIDRAIFWERMKKIADAKERFKFKAQKKDKATGSVSMVEKEVFFQ